MRMCQPVTIQCLTSYTRFGYSLNILVNTLLRKKSLSTSAWHRFVVGCPSGNTTRTSRSNGESRYGYWQTLRLGYNYSFDVYHGKDADLDTTQNIGKISGVVLMLAKSLFGKGYTIFFDRFYTSPNLLYWLRRVDLSGCGTTMINRSRFPKQPEL